MKNSQPIFQSVFGAEWQNMPRVMHRHYANHSHSYGHSAVEGSLTVTLSPAAKLLAPLFKLTGTLVPYAGQNIPVTVDFSSNPRNNHFGFDRVFYFPGLKPYRFRSTIIPAKGSETHELMRFGLVWRADYLWQDGKVQMRHKGYAIKVLNWLLPLPLEILCGRAYAEEIPIDDDHFAMMMEIRHPLWGYFFGYHGTFKIVQD